MPRKLIAPSTNTATDIEIASCTITGSSTLGRTWRRSTHSRPEPMTREAST